MTTAVGLCSAYCEVRNLFTWVKDMHTGVACQADDTACGLSQSCAVSITQSFPFNVGNAVEVNLSKNSSSLLSRDDSTESVLKATFNLVRPLPDSPDHR
jgi:hypothetical protein